MIKAKYYYKNTAVGTVKFEHDRAMQPLCTSHILDGAPAKWDVCRWDHGEIAAPVRKKQKLSETEESSEITVSEDE